MAEHRSVREVPERQQAHGRFRAGVGFALLASVFAVFFVVQLSVPGPAVAKTSPIFAGPKSQPAIEAAVAVVRKDPGTSWPCPYTNLDEFLTGVNDGDIDKAKRVLAKGVGLPPDQLKKEQKSDSVAKWINQMCGTSLTAIPLAAYTRNHGMVAFLLEYRADPNIGVYKGKAALGWASEKAVDTSATQVDRDIKALLEHYGAVNQQDVEPPRAVEGATSNLEKWFATIQTDDNGTVAEMLNAGVVNINVKSETVNYTNTTLLEQAVTFKKYKVARVLLARGATVRGCLPNHRTTQKLSSAFVTALQTGGSLEIARLVLDRIDSKVYCVKEGDCDPCPLLSEIVGAAKLSDASLVRTMANKGLLAQESNAVCLAYVTSTTETAVRVRRLGQALLAWGEKPKLSCSIGGEPVPLSKMQTYLGLTMDDAEFKATWEGQNGFRQTLIWTVVFNISEAFDFELTKLKNNPQDLKRVIVQATKLANSQAGLDTGIKKQLTELIKADWFEAACKHFDKDRLEQLLNDELVKIDLTQREGDLQSTAFDCAVTGGLIEAAKFLHGQSAYMRLCSSAGHKAEQSHLYLAINQGKNANMLQMIKFLIDTEKEYTQRTATQMMKDGCNPFGEVAKGGGTGMVDALVAEGFDISAEFMATTNPFVCRACDRGVDGPSIAKEFLLQGAVVVYSTSFGRCTLNSVKGCLGIAQQCPVLDIKEGLQSQLTWGTVFCNQEAVNRAMITYVSIEDVAKRPAFDAAMSLAVPCGCPGMQPFLKKAIGPSPEEKKQVWFNAATTGNVSKILELLPSIKAAFTTADTNGVDVKNAEGFTAFQVAVKNNQFEACKLLCEKGAGVTDCSGTSQHASFIADAIRGGTDEMLHYAISRELKWKTPGSLQQDCDLFGQVVVYGTPSMINILNANFSVARELQKFKKPLVCTACKRGGENGTGIAKGLVLAQNNGPLVDSTGAFIVCTKQEFEDCLINPVCSMQNDTIKAIFSKFLSSQDESVLQLMFGTAHNSPQAVKEALAKFDMKESYAGVKQSTFNDMLVLGQESCSATATNETGVITLLQGAFASLNQATLDKWCGSLDLDPILGPKNVEAMLSTTPPFDIDASCQDGSTLLDQASYGVTCGGTVNFPIVKVLLKHNATIRQCTDSKRSPAQCAVEKGDAVLLDLIVAKRRVLKRSLDCGLRDMLATTWMEKEDADVVVKVQNMTQALALNGVIFRGYINKNTKEPRLCGFCVKPIVQRSLRRLHSEESKGAGKVAIFQAYLSWGAPWQNCSMKEQMKACVLGDKFEGELRKMAEKALAGEDLYWTSLTWASLFCLDPAAQFVAQRMLAGRTPVPSLFWDRAADVANQSGCAAVLSTVEGFKKTESERVNRLWLEAALKGDAATITSFIKSAIVEDVNVPDGKGETALYKAGYYGNVKVIKALNGTTPKKGPALKVAGCTNESTSPLVASISQEHVDAMSVLLAMDGAAEGCKPLEKVAKYGNELTVAPFFIASKVTIGKDDSVCLACSRKDKEGAVVGRAIVDWGAVPIISDTCKEETFKVCLSTANDTCNTDAFQGNFSQILRNEDTTWTPLAWSALHCNVLAAEKRVDLGESDPNKLYSQYMKARKIALQCGCDKIAKVIDLYTQAHETKEPTTSSISSTTTTTITGTTTTTVTVKDEGQHEAVEAYSCSLPVNASHAAPMKSPCQEDGDRVLDGRVCTPRCQYAFKLPEGAPKDLKCNMGQLDPPTFECVEDTRLAGIVVVTTALVAAGAAATAVAGAAGSAAGAAAGAAGSAAGSAGAVASIDFNVAMSADGQALGSAGGMVAAGTPQTAGMNMAPMGGGAGGAGELKQAAAGLKAQGKCLRNAGVGVDKSGYNFLSASLDEEAKAVRRARFWIMVEWMKGMARKYSALGVLCMGSALSVYEAKKKGATMIPGMLFFCFTVLGLLLVKRATPGSKLANCLQAIAQWGEGVHPRFWARCELALSLFIAAIVLKTKGFDNVTNKHDYSGFFISFVMVAGSIAYYKRTPCCCCPGYPLAIFIYIGGGAVAMCIAGYQFYIALAGTSWDNLTIWQMWSKVAEEASGNDFGNLKNMEVKLDVNFGEAAGLAGMAAQPMEMELCLMDEKLSMEAAMSHAPVSNQISTPWGTAVEPVWAKELPFEWMVGAFQSLLTCKEVSESLATMYLKYHEVPCVDGSIMEAKEFATWVAKLYSEKRDTLIQELFAALRMPSTEFSPQQPTFLAIDLLRCMLHIAKDRFQNAYRDEKIKGLPFGLLCIWLFTMQDADIDRLCLFTDVPGPPQNKKEEEAYEHYTAYRQGCRIARNPQMFEVANWATRAAWDSFVEQGSVREDAHIAMNALLKWQCTLSCHREVIEPSVTVYRAFCDVPSALMDKFRQKEKGDILFWANMTSTTLGHELAEIRAMSGNPDNNMMVSVTGVREGWRLKDISMYPNEAELLLPMCAVLKVKRVSNTSPLRIDCFYESCALSKQFEREVCMDMKNCQKLLDASVVKEPEQPSRASVGSRGGPRDLRLLEAGADR